MLDNIKTIHIIGIGGISLSAIALILKNKGFVITGSDETLTSITDNLIAKGIRVSKGENLNDTRNADAIIVCSAIPSCNAELKLSKELNKKIFKRSEILGMISKEYSKTISIAGSHGKTTTTGMIAEILVSASLDPTVHIGGLYKGIGGNVRLGGSNLFVTEACEYKDSFLDLSSFIGIVLSVQEDHLDYFINLENIQKSFSCFSHNISASGYFIVNNDDENARKLSSFAKKITYGLTNDSDVFARNIKFNECGLYTFDIVAFGAFICNISLSVIGRHNIYNALAAFTACMCLSVKKEDIKLGLEKFSGVDRRFELIKKTINSVLVHDYAHHPTEIIATLSAIRTFYKGKVIIVFQPHTYSRTRDLFDGFVSAFNDADEIWLLPIYPAREDPIAGITSEVLGTEISKLGKHARCLKDFNECIQMIEYNLKEKCFIVIVGAGNILSIAKYFESEKNS
ncbi:MAG: UDP-N-acetylmuramate--L-alanine ligase [Clostridia bacterium]